MIMLTVLRNIAILIISLSVTTICLAGEDAISIDKVPAAVKTAIEKETAGNKITEISKEKHRGITIYEVDYVKDGKKREVSFTEDGKVTKTDADEGQEK